MYNFSYVICVDSGIAVHSPSDIYTCMGKAYIHELRLQIDLQ